MKTKTMTAFLILAATAMTTAACFRSYGHRRYPGTPRFASNDYAYVQLLRREPAPTAVLGSPRCAPAYAAVLAS